MKQKIERLMSLAQKCHESFMIAHKDSTLRPYLNQRFVAHTLLWRYRSVF